MLSSIVRSIIRSTSQQDERDRSPLERPFRPDDNEEDGFLVVGQTASERTTIKTSEFQGHLDSPPEYNSVSQVSSDTACLPSYVEYCRSTSQRDTMEHTNINNSNVHITPVSDVPLVISPELQLTIDLLKNTPQSQALSTGRLDLSNFNYDFVLEESVLKELHGSDLINDY